MCLRACVPARLWLLWPHYFTLVYHFSPTCLPLFAVPCGCSGLMIVHLSPTVSSRLWVGGPMMFTLVSHLSPVSCRCFGRMIFHSNFSPTVSSPLWVCWPHDFTFVSHLHLTVSSPLWVLWPHDPHTCLPFVSHCLQSFVGALECQMSNG